jgi:hypothetical protein
MTIAVQDIAGTQTPPPANEVAPVSSPRFGSHSSRDTGRDGAPRLPDTGGNCRGDRKFGGGAKRTGTHNMQIELIGCTSSGKSSLIQDLIHANGQNGFQLITSYDYVLRWAHLNWVKNHRLRMLSLNIIALFSCLFTWRKNLSFYRFVVGVIWRLPAKVSLSVKLKIARITARNVGIYEIVSRYMSARQIILADEGTLHIAHYLFVHTAVEPDIADLDHFARLVSLPDVAVYVRQPESVLVSRTCRKGHKRIPKGDVGLVACFIQRSLSVFEKLVSYSNLADRMVIVHNEEVIQPPWDDEDNTRLAFARKIFDLHKREEKIEH